MEKQEENPGASEQRTRAEHRRPAYAWEHWSRHKNRAVREENCSRSPGHAEQPLYEPGNGLRAGSHPADGAADSQYANALAANAADRERMREPRGDCSGHGSPPDAFSLLAQSCDSVETPGPLRPRSGPKTH